MKYFKQNKGLPNPRLDLCSSISSRAIAIVRVHSNVTLLIITDGCGSAVYIVMYSDYNMSRMEQLNMSRIQQVLFTMFANK